MQKFILIFVFGLLATVSIQARDITNFNFDWQFALADEECTLDNLNKLEWKQVRVPHDWSIELGYTQEDTACSTGFLKGGIGWYRKQFSMDVSNNERVWVEFDGVYNNSTVWINGHKLGFRPYGYASFSYELTPYLKETNEIVVHVDRTNYADSRWYTGSGIYRNVRLVKKNASHIPQWGVRITTPKITQKSAVVKIASDFEIKPDNAPKLSVEMMVCSQDGETVARKVVDLEPREKHINSTLRVKNPELWDLENPNLYTATVSLKAGPTVLDSTTETFGIRKISYDANKGFFLNDKPVKFKGVNLHHAAGGLGAAVPKDIWYSRVQKLKDIGCNGIRMSHNPHSPELLQACDELGILVLAEAFDEWNIAKKKSVVFLSDNSAPPEISRSYPEVFDEWAERDLKDLIKRDFNHPSVIMWSIGNEIEWTFPYYHQSIIYEKGNVQNEAQGDDYKDKVAYAPEPIMEKMKELLDGKEDVLTKIAYQLDDWVKEVDTTRFTTCGSVRPSVALASGYADAVDILGFNYRAVEYDTAHEYYPEVYKYGSENWTTWQEWQDVKDRDFMGGIFVWTGFAYLGEAGPWPRKGLNLAMFDFVGNKTPRGHMFEAMWKEEPKIFMETVPMAESEFSYDAATGWTFTERAAAVPKMQWVRKWEWYNMNPHWNYESGNEILVQAYTNCPEAELFLNGKSLGVKKLADFENGGIKWIVPHSRGILKVVGYNKDGASTQYAIQSSGTAHCIKLSTNQPAVDADGESIIEVYAQLFDINGVAVTNDDQRIQFIHDGPVERLAVDNGSEYNVENHTKDSVTSWEGRAYAVYRVKNKEGIASIKAVGKDLTSSSVKITVSSERLSVN